jgi:elongation factor Ts
VTIDAKTVKELREKTGCGFMDCKAALKESDGDLEAAVDYLRKKGMAAASRKAHRETSEGLIEAFLADDGKVGALVEVNCETDFVARTDDFKSLVGDLTRQAAETGGEAADATAMLAQPFVIDGSQTVQDVLNATVGKMGENMRLRRFARFALEGEGAVAAYIHPGSRIGVLIEVGCGSAAAAAAEDFKVLMRDLAMQVAASAPAFLEPGAVPEDVIAREKNVLMEQAKESGKPENVLEKIVEGRIKKFFEENCLLEQKFIKDPDRRVREVIGDCAGKLGEELRVHRFQRFHLGED